MQATNRFPLSGRRIVITRAREQAGVLREALVALGAEVVEVPTIEIRNPSSWDRLDDAIRRLEDFDYLVATSVHGVRKFLGRLQACGRGVEVLTGMQVGAIGPTTAAELARAGVHVDFVPTEYRAEGLVEVLQNHDLSGKWFLIPRARVARDLLRQVLIEKGARVEVVEAYETVIPVLPAGKLEELFTPRPDAITFTSSSTASNFARLIGDSKVRETLAGIVIASIGPVTSNTIRSLGLSVDVEAGEFTVPGLVRAIQEYFSGRPAGEIRGSR